MTEKVLNIFGEEMEACCFDPLTGWKRDGYCNTDDFDFIAHHRGMFSRLGLNADQVVALREKHGMYVVGDSRINIAGLAGDRHLPFASAVAKVVNAL